MPKISPTRRFYKDLLHLPQDTQDKVWQSIDTLSRDPKHPSLRIKKMSGRVNVWEGRITKAYRFTFEIKGDLYILRRVGTHDILKKGIK